MAATTTENERPASLRKPVFTSFVSHEDITFIQKIQLKQTTELLDFKFQPMMGVIKSIFHHALFTSEMVSQEISPPPESNRMLDDQDNKFDIKDNKIRATIHRLSLKIICESACGKGEKEAAFALLDLLSEYSWEAKMVLVLAAFSMTYGMLWTNAKPVNGNPLAELVCKLLQPSLVQKNESIISRFNSLKNLVNVMLTVADHMIKLKELTKMNETQVDVSTTNALQFAVYWIIRSVYSCLSYSLNFLKMDYEYTSSTGEIQEIIEYSHKLTKVHEYLIQICKQEQEYFDLQIVFKRTDQGVAQLITKFCSAEYLVSGTRKVSLDYLYGKTVGFFITHFDVNMKDFTYLETTYNKLIKKEKKFEVVWIPTVDQTIEWSNTHQKTFEDVAVSMQWSRLCGLSSITWAFMRYIQEKWHFQKKPILVMLGDHCQVINIDALSTVEICGEEAFPFTIQDEEKIIWKTYEKPIWQLLLQLYEELHVNLQELVKGKVVCFYGGLDCCWIKDFGNRIDSIKQKIETKFKMEIIYIGTSGTIRTKKILPYIVSICTSSQWKTDSWKLDTINTFWRRLTYLYNKRTINCKMDLQEDAIVTELMTLLTYDHSEDGWAIMFGGSSEEMHICRANLNECLTRFESWESNIQGPADFVKTLKNNIRSTTTEEHCSSMMVTKTTTITSHVRV